MIFAEIEVFQQVIFNLLSQEEFRKLQNELLANPKAGSVIQKFLAVFEKSKRIDLTNEDKKNLRYIIETLKMEFQ